jgi:membrane protein
MKKATIKTRLKSTWEILKETALGFSDDKGLKLSASLSYYTAFSIAPLLLLIISIVGAIFGEEAIEGKIFDEINGLIGNQAAVQVQEIIRNLRLSGKTTMSLVIGAVTLIIGATTVFAEIQDSINMIWRVKAKPKRGWLKLIKDRLLSGSIIIGLGFLLVVTLMVNGFVTALNDILSAHFPDVAFIIFNTINVIISFLVITVLFGVIFKVLPDAEITWKEVRMGAFFTAILFMFGRYLINLYIETTAAGSPYGAAGSIIIILLWVYYTAAILYLGAEFTRVYANHIGASIRPSEFAVYVEQKEVERNVSEIPTDDKKKAREERERREKINDAQIDNGA